MKTKIIALVLTILSVFSFSLGVLAEEVSEPYSWDGTPAQGFESGDGSGRDPFVIKTAEQLAFFANSVNGGESYKDKRVELHADIDLGKTPWTPIGSEESPFMGTFMGRSHRISGIYISDKQGKNMGLFGCIRSARIYNLVIADSYIECAETAGAVAGKSIYGSIANCRNYATVVAESRAGGMVGINIGGDIEECINFGFIYAGNGGGIAGVNSDSDGNGVIVSCRNMGNVVGGSNVGGIIGADEDGSSVKNCINGASIAAISRAGGIAGYLNGGSISSCRNSGRVYAEGGESFAGGILGIGGGSIKNSYSCGDVSGNKYVGGIAGKYESGEIICCYSVGVAAGGEYTGAVAGDIGSARAEYCYYMSGGAADKQGKNLFGIGNTQTDGSGTVCLNYEAMKWGEAYQGFDFEVWTTGGSIDYNYPELISHQDLDSAYALEYGDGDRLREDVGTQTPSGDAQTHEQQPVNIPWWTWLIIGIAVVGLFAVLIIKARNK